MVEKLREEDYPSQLRLATSWHNTFRTGEAPTSASYRVIVIDFSEAEYDWALCGSMNEADAESILEAFLDPTR